MNQLKSVLVAVDFSANAGDAFRQAARIAEWSEASLSAFHAIAPPEYVPPPDSAARFAPPSNAELVARAEERWNGFVPDCAARKSTRLEIWVGNPRREILERVRRDTPGLLVLGSHGEFDADKDIGSIAAACVQRAGTKVLLVRKGHASVFKKVVACIDFTETSRNALEQAVRVTAQDNAKLVVLHVYDDPWSGIGPPDAIKLNMPDFKDWYGKSVKDRLRSFCAPFAHELNALKAEFHGEQSEWRGGGYGHAIAKFAKVQECDLVVLGTRAKWNLRDAFWGSTAECVVRSAPCSILTVKPEGFEQPAIGGR